jgi:hypothetical protein
VLGLLRRLLPQVRLGTAWIVCLVLAATPVVALVAAERFDGAARTAAWVVYFAALAALVVLAVVTVVLTVSALVSVRTAGGGPSPVPVLAAAVLLLAVFGAVPAAYVLLPVPTSARTVSNDLERATDAARFVGSGGSCEERRNGRWRCSVSDPSASGEAGYVVRADARCWRARRFREGMAHMPPSASGCTTLRDLIGLPW